jgi:hypothetical protein
MNLDKVRAYDLRTFIHVYKRLFVVQDTSSDEENNPKASSLISPCNHVLLDDSKEFKHSTFEYGLPIDYESHL